MKNKFLKYLLNEAPVKMTSSKKRNQPMLPGVAEPEENLITDYNNMSDTLKSIRYKNLSSMSFKQRKNKLLKQLGQSELEQTEPLLFEIDDKKIKENEWREEIKKLNDIIDGDKNKYQTNLKKILNLFFNIGGKMSKRRVYIPLTRAVNFSKVEELNRKNYFEMVLNIKHAQFIELDEIDIDVIAYLESFDYKVVKKDYFNNKCVNKNGKSIPIDMELKKISEINIDKKEKFILKTKDAKLIEEAKTDIEKRKQFKDEFLERMNVVKTYLNIMFDKIIVMTWSPLSVLSQSTGTQWTSCMTFGNDEEASGSNIHYVQPSITNGVFIAWLVDIEDKSIMKPVARALIKPFVADLASITEKKKNLYWWPSTVYSDSGKGNVIKIFKDTLRRYFIYKQKNIFDFSKKNVFRLEGQLVNDEEIYPDSEEKMDVIEKDATMSLIKKQEVDESFSDMYNNFLKSYNLESKDLMNFMTNTNVLKYVNYAGSKKHTVFAILTNLIKQMATFNNYKALNYLMSKLNEDIKKELMLQIFVKKEFDSSSLDSIFSTNVFFNYFVNQYFFKLNVLDEIIKKQTSIDNFVSHVYNFSGIRSEIDFDGFMKKILNDKPNILDSLNEHGLTSFLVFNRKNKIFIMNFFKSNVNKFDKKMSAFLDGLSQNIKGEYNDLLKYLFVDLELDIKKVMHKPNWLIISLMSQKNADWKVQDQILEKIIPVIDKETITTKGETISKYLLNIPDEKYFEKNVEKLKSLGFDLKVFLLTSGYLKFISLIIPKIKEGNYFEKFYQDFTSKTGDMANLLIAQQYVCNQKENMVDTINDKEINKLLDSINKIEVDKHNRKALEQTVGAFGVDLVEALQNVAKTKNKKSLDSLLKIFNVFVDFQEQNDIEIFGTYILPKALTMNLKQYNLDITRLFTDKTFIDSMFLSYHSIDDRVEIFKNIEKEKIKINFNGTTLSYLLSMNMKNVDNRLLTIYYFLSLIKKGNFVNLKPTIDNYLFMPMLTDFSVRDFNSFHISEKEYLDAISILRIENQIILNKQIFFISLFSTYKTNINVFVKTLNMLLDKTSVKILPLVVFNSFFSGAFLQSITSITATEISSAMNSYRMMLTKLNITEKDFAENLEDIPAEAQVNYLIFNDNVDSFIAELIDTDRLNILNVINSNLYRYHNYQIANKGVRIFDKIIEVFFKVIKTIKDKPKVIEILHGFTLYFFRKNMLRLIGVYSEIEKLYSGQTLKEFKTKNKEILEGSFGKGEKPAEAQIKFLETI